MNAPRNTPNTKKRRTDLSRNPGVVVPSSVTSSSPRKSTRKPKKKMPQTESVSRGSRKRIEEQRPLEENVDDDDNLSDVSEDPVDKYNLSAEEEIDDEPRFKYSTAELPDHSSRNTRCCIVAMCVLCIIVAIAVSILMFRIPKNREEEKASEASPPPVPPPTANGSGMFNETRESVDNACINSGVACQEICKDFDCCDPSLNEQASCFFGNRQGCLDYSRCHVTNPGTTDPPSPNINSICSKTAVANDPGPCIDACLSAKCCWETTSSCIDANFYACADYAICQNLRGPELKVPQPIDGLKELCDDFVVGSMTQREACEVACAEANCCWETTAANCLQSNFFTCILHEPCGKLTFPEAFSYVPEPIDDTSTVCSKPYRDVNGSGKCEASCNRARCCTAAPGENCFLQDPLGCMKYDGCKLLNVT